MAVAGQEFGSMGALELAEWLEAMAHRIKAGNGQSRDCDINSLALAIPVVASRLSDAARPSRPTDMERIMAAIWACQRMERALFDHLDRHPDPARVKECGDALLRALWELPQPAPNKLRG